MFRRTQQKAVRWITTAVSKDFEARVANLVAQIDEKSARKKLIRMMQNPSKMFSMSGVWINDEGENEDFVVAMSYCGITVGVRSIDGFGEISEYDENGELLYGFGKDMTLEELTEEVMSV